MLRNGMSNIKMEPQIIEHNQAPSGGMSLWAKVRELEGEALQQIQSLYGINFPIEFRHYFADLIESRRWDQLDPDNINDEPQARHILGSFLTDIERQCENLTEARDFLQRLRFSEIANHFKTIYGPAPLELVRTAKKILSIESSLVNQSNSLGDGGVLSHLSQQTEKVIHINRELDRLTNMTRDTDNDLRKLQSKQEYFVINYQESRKISTYLQQVQQLAPNDQARMQDEPKLIKKQQEVDSLLRLEAQKLLQLRVGIADKHKETFGLLTQLQNQILEEELIQWKRAQALAYNGVQHENNLDQLQQWCERLAEIIWQNRQQIKKVELQRQQLPINNPGRDLLPELNSTITSLLSTLVTSTFIIEKQPPQVLKTQTRFGATIRLLVGGKLNVHMNPPTVKASIISEAQAKALLKNENRSLAEMSGDILNRESVMEYHPQTGILSVNFRNMSLRRIKRSDKRGAESVTEEKFTVLFQSQFSVGGNELVFQVRTLSLPVVVIVHGNQEANAAASILWDNAFAEQGRIPFQVPDKVPWCKLIESLDHKWKHETRSPRGLTMQAKQYLAYKVFKQTVMPNSEKLISWAQFNREPLPKRNFTFWQWYNGVMELTKSKHLQVHWNDGAIIGFIGKAESQEKLLSMPNRTFLLRYSDSEIGGLTIAWVADENGVPKVWNLQPQTLRDYGIRSLADRINDLGQLMYLCKADDTTKMKDEVFGQYYCKTGGSSSEQPDGYVRTELMQHIPSQPPISQMSLFSDTSAPSTPQSNYDAQLMHNSPPPSNAHPIPFDVQSEAGSNSNFAPNEVGSGMEYDESLGDHFDSSCNIDVNELLSRHM
ncbi:signal transducer and activator of transcription 5B-like isoform X2 [Styela clava]|uniref:signal transducer and activator of transcription 5B-like isoform X1 n=2 Tax=Styela clava TaxID=7725 RepID=UPI00193AC500|nr:signal transducer and activator of transcription 5B-like isoform X1 [Styela clava]XP_039268531.1 signal transducer and activator of transcription 5B-like isoform X1 [Styela clava]